MMIVARIILCWLLLSASSAMAAEMSEGAYIAKLGDCISCHTAPGKPDFSGGLPLKAPIGTIYSTNITPDKEHGIGNYTVRDFSRALREGIAKDGHRLYPAMPYPSFSKMTDHDILALYNYFMHEVKPVAVTPTPTKLTFPFNQRWGISLWDMVFKPGKVYQPKPNQDIAWNRGAYLVQSVAHCGACHTPRGIAYEEKAYTEDSKDYLKGAMADMWFANNLRGDDITGLGKWQVEDIARFLKTGHNAEVASFGGMSQVVENSTQYLRNEDAHAIAYYLKFMTAAGEHASYHPGATPGYEEYPGAGLYQNFCASCHQANGMGVHDKYPPLAGNPVVLADNPASVIRLILEGSSAARTQAGTGASMPGFGKKFTDGEIADTVNFIRHRWGNNSATVTVRDVEQIRKHLAP